MFKLIFGALVLLNNPKHWLFINRQDPWKKKKQTVEKLHHPNDAHQPVCAYQPDEACQPGLMLTVNKFCTRLSEKNFYFLFMQLT